MIGKIEIELEDEEIVIRILHASEEEAAAGFEQLAAQLASGRISILVNDGTPVALEEFKP